MAVERKLGILLLSIYLIAVGIQGLISLNFAYMHQIMAVLAIAAGVTLLLKK